MKIRTIQTPPGQKRSPKRLIRRLINEQAQREKENRETTRLAGEFHKMLTPQNISDLCEVTESQICIPDKNGVFTYTFLIGDSDIGYRTETIKDCIKDPTPNVLNIRPGFGLTSRRKLNLLNLYYVTCSNRKLNLSYCKNLKELSINNANLLKLNLNKNSRMHIQKSGSTIKKQSQQAVRENGGRLVYR